MSEVGYFDGLYAESSDPWRLATSPYEQRKLSVLLASLPLSRYRCAFEPGCSIGVTTAALARRCDAVVAMDLASAAVRQARERLAGLPVTVLQGAVPTSWPEGRFDLIMLSELLYYLDHGDRQTVADRLTDSLESGGDVVAVHWRPRFAEATAGGDDVQRELRDRLLDRGFEQLIAHVEPQFLLHVFRRPGG